MQTTEYRVTRNQLFEIHSGLSVLRTLPLFRDAALVVAKNFRILQQEVDDIQAALTPTEAFQVYDRARVELCQQYAKKAPDGVTPLLDPKTESFIIEDTERAEFEEKLGALKEENAQAITAEQSRQAEFDKWMGDEVSLVCYPVLFAYLPEKLEPSTVERLLPVLTEPDES